MASYGRVLEVLRDYRNVLAEETQAEVQARFGDEVGEATTFAARGEMSAFATPLSNVHATGVGIRVRGGEPVMDEFVLKVFVFDKVPMDEQPELLRGFEGVEVDVEPLPIQRALRGRGGAFPQRQRHRPVTGGLSIAPLGVDWVGTLGCFLRGASGGTEQIFALSNNHVIADINALPIGTPIVQPGPERGAPAPGQADVFAALSAFVPIQFPTRRGIPVINQVDAAIAIVPDLERVQLGEMFGIDNYTPRLLAPVPGMRVTKSGRTTGVTTGVITATRVSGVRVDYGTETSPRIAVFNNAIEMRSFRPFRPFGSLGDSGSVILELESGRPVALLYASDGVNTTACDLGAVCEHFQAFPA